MLLLALVSQLVAGAGASECTKPFNPSVSVVQTTTPENWTQFNFDWPWDVETCLVDSEGMLKIIANNSIVFNHTVQWTQKADIEIK